MNVYDNKWIGWDSERNEAFWDEGLSHEINLSWKEVNGSGSYIIPLHCNSIRGDKDQISITQKVSHYMTVHSSHFSRPSSTWLYKQAHSLWFTESITAKSDKSKRDKTDVN